MQRSAPLQSLSISIPDLWQQQAVQALREGFDVVVHAPTGAGKTFIFELLYQGLKGQAVFTVPTRALANDKLSEWRKRGWEVGIATGDISEGLDRRVLVATLETQRARLLSGSGPKLLVIDEYQMISDPVRGVHYELAVALAPAQTQLLLLSGSVSNPHDVVSWLTRIGRKAKLISHSHRPVPLEEVDFTNLGGHSTVTNRSLWPLVIRHALKEDLGPVLLFAPRRKASEQLAMEISAGLPPCQPLALSETQTQLAGRSLARLLKNRVAFHHSGLSFAQRSQLVEPLAKAGQLRVVVATMGLASGINFSMRSVAVAGTSYLAGPFERRVSAAELLQMFGRAGRRGLDETGYALVTQHPPRLGDAQPLPLKRSNQLDWTTLIAVMHHAVLRGESPFPAAVGLNGRLFSSAAVPMGCEQSLETGPMACGLQVDAERARYLRRGTQEMLGSKNNWEPLTPAQNAPLRTVLIHLPTEDGQQEKWIPAESNAAFMQPLAKGPLCRLPGNRKRYGRELHIGHRRGDGMLQLSPKLKELLGTKLLSLEEIQAAVLEHIPKISGGSPVALLPRGDQLFVQISFEETLINAHLDESGAALLTPPTRRIPPATCNGCPQRDWCETVPIADSAAMAWRTLGLIKTDGTTTRRGIIFSFFQHGEGLAVAAALEDAAYSIEELVFDIADLRGGLRFSEEDGQTPGRLALVCQRTFKSADHEGYLRFGVPCEYGAGVSEAIRAIIEQGTPKQQLISESLRMGDIERALLEWRSLLRHIAHAPAYDWDRWESLRQIAMQKLKS